MKSNLFIYERKEGFSLSLNQSIIEIESLENLSAEIEAVHEGMQAIENGEIKNPDENRKVTHFTDRQDYASSDTFQDVEQFFEKVFSGEILGSTHKHFNAIIVNGIGGSALGPQFLQFAINGPYWNELPDSLRKGLKIYFTDNTDSSGLNDILAVVDLERTLVLSISKSGGTRETKNNLTAIETIYAEKGVEFSPHATAVTMEGSKLDNHAKANDWLKIWPMADSIGGRTSETAIVGHVPAAAAGICFKSLLSGACLMDDWTREADLFKNPAYMLAATWYIQGEGKGNKNMVIVPYSDRLVLLSKYLQQLVMESIGKRYDLDGNLVEQGLTVFGNKGGTDAHAYIQQMNDGRNDFFMTFIEVLKDQENYSTEGTLNMGDYLHNFMQGLSNALYENNRSVLRITVEELNSESIGMLIALYERAVAAYAELININAFHQPGVEAYKKISESVNQLSVSVQQFICDNEGFSGQAEDFATAMENTDLKEEVSGILAKYCLNNRMFGQHSLSREFDGDSWTYTIG